MLDLILLLQNADILINDIKILQCFKWGRSVHEKVLKVMQQQLTANVVAIIINCMAAVYYGHIPLNAVQVLSLFLLLDLNFCLFLSMDVPY